MKLSKNINSNEISCKCGCGFNKASTTLIEMVQDVRNHFNKPVLFTSCCRCKKHNKNEGGAKRSYHLPDLNNVARGADIRVKDIDNDDVADYLEKKYPNSAGIGRYKSWTHIDDRPRRARWDNR